MAEKGLLSLCMHACGNAIMHSGCLSAKRTLSKFLRIFHAFAQGRVLRLVQRTCLNLRWLSVQLASTELLQRIERQSDSGMLLACLVPWLAGVKEVGPLLLTCK